VKVKVTVYPFGKAVTTDLQSAAELHNFIDSWFSLSTRGDIEIAFDNESE
jgi:hypothetical protein